MDDDTETCPECGHVGPSGDFFDESDVAQANGSLTCPECSACICDFD